jgi:hypothetical protein
MKSVYIFVSRMKRTTRRKFIHPNGIAMVGLTIPWPLKNLTL